MVPRGFCQVDPLCIDSEADFSTVICDFYGRINGDNDWIGLREKLNRKPELFSHEDHGAFRLRFSRENQSNDITGIITKE